MIGLTVLRHTDYDSETREAYLKRRRLEEHIADGEESAVEPSSLLGDELFAEMKDVEQFMLVVTANGFGKRSSAYEYRVTGRGGAGDHEHRRHRPQRRRGCFVPGAGFRPADAG